MMMKALRKMLENRITDDRADSLFQDIREYFVDKDLRDDRVISEQPEEVMGEDRDEMDNV